MLKLSFIQEEEPPLYEVHFLCLVKYAYLKLTWGDTVLESCERG